MNASSGSVAALGTLGWKIREAINRGTALFLRQSSPRQVERNTGSVEAQRQQLKYLEPFGIEQTSVLEFDALGESAREGVERPAFERLMRAIEAKTIGLVVVSHYDRLARNAEDSARVHEVLARNGGILLVGMNFYDPSDPTHKMLLGIQGVLSQFENQQRALRITMSRAAKATKLEYPVPLPTGLVWASPDDAEYCARLRKAGLEEHLRSLDQHKAVFTRDGRNYYVLPYPDADVYRSVVLRFEWLYKHGSIPAVIERMKSDPWPRPGLIPIGRGGVYDSRQSVTWVELTHRTDGKTPFVRGGLYKWYHSPALYGTYAFESERLAKYALEGGPGAAVSSRKAFPSFREPEDLERTRELFRNAPKCWKRGSFTGPRTNLRAYVRCGGLRANGTRCNKRMSPVFSSTAERGIYVNIMCAEQHGHHSSVLVPVLDDAVRSIVAEAYTPAVIKGMLDKVGVQKDADAARTHSLAARSQGLQQQIDYCVTKQESAASGGDSEEERYWSDRRSALLKERRRIENEREVLAERGVAARSASRAELDRLKQMTARLPELLEASRSIEGAERELVNALVREVHVRAVGFGAYWVIVTLPSGAQSERIVFSTGLGCTPQQRAFVAAQLNQWLDPVARFADETAANAAANALVKQLNVPGLPLAWRSWNPARVWAAAYTHCARPDAGRAEHGRTIAEIAALVGEPEPMALQAALQGRLGPAVVRDGVFTVAPSERELHITFPEFARRCFANQNGWPVEDTVSLLELALDVGLDYGRIRSALSAVTFESARSVRICYVRKSGVLAQPRVVLSMPCDAAAKDAKHYLTESEARRLLPWCAPSTLHESCPTLRPSSGPSGRRTVYLWMGPEQLQAIRNRSRSKVWSRLSRQFPKTDERVYGTRKGREKGGVAP